MTTNPTIPMNIYRQSTYNNPKDLFHEMEQYMQAYYNLIDDCKEYPIWKRKLQEDLGNSVAYMAIQM